MIGFRAAFQGIFSLIKHEKNFKIQLFIAVAVVVLGWYFAVSQLEWCVLLLNIALVLGLEGVNSFSERLCDLVHPDYSSRVKFVKDAAAGAVLMAAILAAISGILIFYPYIKTAL